MQDQGSPVSFCPSFSSYSSAADIAAKVVEEENIFTLPRSQNDDVCCSDDDGDDDFEFVLVRENRDGNQTAFPIFPVFNQDLLLDNESKNNLLKDDVIRLPLKKLFIQDNDRDSPSSSSSSEADELEGITPGTYCVWTPSKSPAQSPSRCEKSNSTGSSSKRQHQRWRLRDLLHLKRSNSDGKESFIFLNTDRKDKKESGKSVIIGKEKEKKEKVVSAHEVFYVRNKALKDGDKTKRRSYLPYRQGLVGFFAKVN
ncbi:uncharacterized protein LOC126675215 [Mercurialis annua]|uniref:uncharacterized protein LOC126675215 n=1 Tax=Mercurialis annua TaxID=3986 RepID=UPI00215EC92C|nr:uncharacterized protein LOC126675215 [Mercurialis annua]